MRRVTANSFCENLKFKNLLENTFIPKNRRRYNIIAQIILTIKTHLRRKCRLRIELWRHFHLFYN